MDKLSVESKPEECPRYGKCKAPLCPLGPASVEITWLPDESICTMFVLPWILLQRKLRRNKVEGLFNIEMLVAMKQKGNGIDVDSRETPAGWIGKRA